jgi:hypothetical protein
MNVSSHSRAPVRIPPSSCLCDVAVILSPARSDPHCGDQNARLVPRSPRGQPPSWHRCNQRCRRRSSGIWQEGDICRIKGSSDIIGIIVATTSAPLCRCTLLLPVSFRSRNFFTNTLLPVNDLITPKSWLEHQILHLWIAIIPASASICNNDNLAHEAMVL